MNCLANNKTKLTCLVSFTEPNKNEIQSIEILSRTSVCKSTMNLWVTGQCQNKWGMVSTVDEQKEHTFESVMPNL